MVLSAPKRQAWPVAHAELRPCLLVETPGSTLSVKTGASHMPATDRAAQVTPGAKR